MSEKYNRYKDFKSGTKKDLFVGKKIKHVEFIDEKTERENNISTDITHHNIKEEDKEINANESIIIPQQNKKDKKIQVSKDKNINKKQEKDIKKKKDKKEKSKEVLELDINDILNSNNNNYSSGGVLLTELLNIGGNKAKKQEEDIENKQTKEKNPQLTKSVKFEIDNDKLKTEESQQKTYEKKKSNIKNLNLSKTLDNKMITDHNIILNEVDEILSKENMRYLNCLKKEKQIIEKYIKKLDDNQKMIENSEMLKDNLAESKMRSNYINNISKTRKELNNRLELIEQKINSILKEENNKKKIFKKNLTEIFDNNFDNKYNIPLETIQEDERILKTKFRRNMLDKADFEERKLKYYKQKSFDETNQKEEDLFLKRRNEINAKLEKTKKNINEKTKIKEKSYLYLKYKENFEKEEKLLLESIKNKRKAPLITCEELKEYDENNDQQNQNLENNPEEEKKYLQNMNNYRSQTLPINPQGKAQKLKIINTRHNFIKINKSISINSNNKSSKDNLLQTESTNKKRVNIFRYSYINQYQKNYDNHFRVMNKSLKGKRKLKPIQILHRKQDETRDFSKGKSRKRRIIFKKKCKSFNFEDLFEDKKEGKSKENNEKCLKSLDVERIRNNIFDQKILKKDDMSMSAALLTNPYLMNEIGGFLADSIQEKLNIINSLSLKKDEK